MRPVIAIAGPIGSGKSTLVRGLAQAIPSSIPLHFDHYERASLKSIPQLRSWLDAGADFDAFEAPNLAADLTRLKASRPLSHAAFSTGPENAPIFFEMPLGRQWSATRASIDLLIWIDIPLDLALARRLREIITRSASAEETLPWIDGYLNAYQAVVAEILSLQAAKIRPAAEVVIDGRGSPQALLAQSLSNIAQWFPHLAQTKPQQSNP